ncbi:MAG: cupredoxin domain-containing protein [Candidatus Rokuibacteriota bacterium]|nr:MAG: cupredoxin domain-containing protein [Candidatus Rokubacteria bacterium]
MRLALVLLALVAVIAMAGCNQEQKSPAGPQLVRLAVTDRGFEPPRAEVPRGQAFTLVVTRKTDQTCAKEILIPALNERRTLPLNQAVRINVPNGVADTLNYICGMHMLGGTVAAK